MTATIAELEARIAELEAQIGQPTASTLQPNVLTVKNGLIGADFTGHVHAQGLDLDAGTNNTPPSQDRIRWLRTSDGGMAASIFGYSQGGTEAVSLAAAAVAQADRAIASLDAYDDQGVSRAELGVQQTNRGAGLVSAYASLDNGQFATLLDDTGASSFLQLLSAHEVHIDDNGGAFYNIAIPIIAGGGNWATSFNTARAGWTVAVMPVVAISGAFLLWDWSFTGPNTINLTFANPWGFAQPAGTARVYCAGK